ncbi:hypothetical protein ST47_g853 [Ascochyta rabiei]|uniref:Uncharacterized protein n=1 Tax=Didymella rabiei TaxID=5454 RepID=A0A163LQX3_DIDRA|nr:hypothetical protein ST47_g853 [Ascochyta rabiei]
MEAVHNHSLHNDLPEAVSEPDYSIHKFSIPASPQPRTTVHPLPAVHAESPSPKYSVSEEPRVKQRKWTRWPLLLLYGLLLTVIAGVAGGLIGKTIERNNHNRDAYVNGVTYPSPTSGSAQSLSSSSSPSSSVSPSTPTVSSTVFKRTIPQPTSGCTSAAPYRSFKSRSNFINIPYSTICGQGWLDFDLTAMSVATQSDCIESCSMYNAHKQTGDRSCVGAGFLPAWWNQTLAMVESKITPYNCFLKTNTSGIARNNEKFEVIALCMQGECDDISG